jgi:hypothetical protein
MSLHKKQPSLLVNHELEIKLFLFIFVWFLILFLFLLITDKTMSVV